MCSPRALQLLLQEEEPGVWVPAAVLKLASRVTSHKDTRVLPFPHHQWEPVNASGRVH